MKLGGLTRVDLYCMHMLSALIPYTLNLYHSPQRRVVLAPHCIKGAVNMVSTHMILELNHVKLVTHLTPLR